MKCRKQCGACCIAPSITSKLPLMPKGKPAGVPCIHLDEEYLCKIFNSPERPKVCSAFQAEESICGENRDMAMATLTYLEGATIPSPSH